MKPLRLLARDGDDIQVVASTLQDAVVAVGTMSYDPVGHAFVLRASRFRHETDSAERVLTGVRIDGVLGVRTRGIDRTDPESFTVLLDVAFVPGEAPGGELRLVFAGGGAIALEVEAVEVTLADVGAARPVSAIPAHD